MNNLFARFSARKSRHTRDNLGKPFDGKDAHLLCTQLLRDLGAKQHPKQQRATGLHTQMSVAAYMLLDYQHVPTSTRGTPVQTQHWLFKFPLIR